MISQDVTSVSDHRPHYPMYPAPYTQSSHEMGTIKSSPYPSTTTDLPHDDYDKGSDKGSDKGFNKGY